MPDSHRLSSTVRSMVQLKEVLLEFMKCEIGNGENRFDLILGLIPGQISVL